MMMPRRAALLTPAALAAAADAGQLTLGLHQFTSARAGYRRSLEGWARAGIKQVEPVSSLLDAFLATESLAAARRVVDDLGLTVVSGAVGTTGLWEPNPLFPKNLDAFKKRCEQFAALGAPVVYSPCVTSARFSDDDYRRSIGQIRQVADVAREFHLKVAAEFVRSSTFMASLPTALRLRREAAHPDFGILFDCYHFWSGPSKFEDLDLIQPGEIIHAHLNDVPEMPRELLDLQTRVIPGDGVAPLPRILRKLADRGYRGPITVELFLPKFQQADPAALAEEIRRKAAGVFQQAKV